MPRIVDSVALESCVQDVLASLGQSLWGMEFLPEGKRAVLKVFLGEGPGQEHGVTIDQLTEASRSLSAALDAQDLIHAAYTLEVSSPGMDRRFFSPRQLDDYVGQEVSVVLRDPLIEEFPGRKRLSGVLKSREGERLTLVVEPETPLVIEWRDIKKARLVPHFPDPGEQKKKNKPGAR